MVQFWIFCFRQACPIAAYISQFATLEKDDDLDVVLSLESGESEFPWSVTLFKNIVHAL